MNILFVFLSVLVVCSCWDEFPLEEYTLSKPFDELGEVGSNWRLGGAAVALDSHVQLTDDLPSQAGALWNTHKCLFRHWSLELVFRIHGRSSRFFGDGLAIWYVKSVAGCPTAPHCTVFGGADHFSGLAVLLDTFNNYHGLHSYEHPYVSVMVNNGSIHYDQQLDGGPHTHLTGCSATQLVARHSPATATNTATADTARRIRVRYVHNQLTVLLDADGAGVWRQCGVTLDHVHLPVGYYFGVTAATGQLHERHDLLAFRLVQLDASETPHLDHTAAAAAAAAASVHRSHSHMLSPYAVKPSTAGSVAAADARGGGVWQGVQKLLLLLFSVAVVCVGVVLFGLLYGHRLGKHIKRHY